MKFAKYLESESIPEWRKAYINYKGLKKRLKAIEKYRKLNHVEENVRLQNAIQDIDDAPDLDYPNRIAPRRPTRTQSSIIDNRSSGLQPRSLSTTNLFKRFSFNFNRQDTELGSVNRPSIPAYELQSISVLEEALRHASEPEQYFFVMLDEDLGTISRFYDEKEKEAEAKYEALKLQVQLVRDFAVQLSHLHSEHDIISADGRLNPMNWFKGRRGSNESDIPDLPASVEYNGDHHMSYNVARSRLKKAITEYYRSLELLKSYKILNETGFQKILKKFDKTAGWKASTLYMEKVRRYHWAKSHKLDEFLHDTENLYIEEFADGHRRRGMAKLRIPERDDHYTPTTWRTGFYIGLSVAFLARVTQLALDPNVQQQLPNLEYNLQIYACFSLPILFCLGFSINTLVWTRSHINYKFIFEFDPRDNLDYHEFAELPSLMLLLLSFMMYVDFSQSFAPLIPSELCPLILFVIIMAALTCPFPILYYSSRRWLSLSLGRIILSYFFPIEFRDFFIADELNSLAYSFWTFSYFVCAYNFHWNDLPTNCPVKIFWYTPFLACLPPWWRFIQCIRRYQDSKEKVHLVNALKYTTSIGSTLATGYRRMYPNASMEVIWILFCIINSSYTSIWDIKMDWGLLQPDSKNPLLRNELVFYRWTYYVAAPLNIILRFGWTLNAAGLGYKGELIGFVTALLEAYRRIQWNFFRLENEVSSLLECTTNQHDQLNIIAYQQLR
ncbi:Xenotropic and polytropic retrovirus receptor 1 [Mucor circinelloides]